MDQAREDRFAPAPDAVIGNPTQMLARNAVPDGATTDMVRGVGGSAKIVRR